jgi:hypothetical protein
MQGFLIVDLRMLSTRPNHPSASRNQLALSTSVLARSAFGCASAAVRYGGTLPLGPVIPKRSAPDVYLKIKRDRHSSFRVMEMVQHLIAP